MQREEGVNPETGVDFMGRWVLRDKNGTYIGHSSFRFDLAETHGFSSQFLTASEFLRKKLK